LRPKTLAVGIGTGLALVGLMIWALFVPVTPKPPIRDESAALWRNFQAIGSRAHTVKKVSLLVAVESPSKISISGHALGGRTITVGSIEDFTRVVGTFQGPGTAMVGFDPSLGGRVLSPPPEVVQTQQTLKQILSEKGFKDPTSD
jgi:hypothetical protein